MSAFWIGMSVMVGFVCFILLAPLIMTVIPRVRSGLGTTAATGAGASGTATTWYRQPSGWIGIAVVLGIAILTIWLAEPSKQTISLLLGLAVIGVLAPLAFFGKGGWPAKLALATFAIGLLLFGARSPEVLEKVQEKIGGAVLDGKPLIPPSGPTHPAVTVPAATAPVVQMQKITVSLSSVPSAPVRVVGGKCIFFWQETPGNHVTELQLEGRKDWLPLEQFRRMTVQKAEWIRWTGDGTLGYELRPDGQCS